MADQKIRLDLDSGRASANAEDLLKSFERLHAEVYALADPIEDATAECYAMAGAEAELTVKSKQSVVGLSAVELALQEVVETSDRAEKKLRDVAESADATHKGAGRLGQGITQASYAFQDFASTSGDLGQKLNSVTNNLMMVTNMMGPYGVAVGIAAVAGVALYRNWDSLASLWEDRKPIEGATEGVEGLTDAVKKNKKALEDLREVGSLNLTQMAEYKRLTTELADEERKLAELREIEANKKNLDKLSNERSQERAGAVKKAVQLTGGFEETIQSLIDMERSFRRGDFSAEDQASFKADMERQLNQALKGDEKAIGRITGVTSRGIGQKNFLDQMIGVYDPQTARNKKAAEEADKEEFQQHMAGMKKQDASRKLGEELTKQGEKFQEDFERQQDEQGAKEFDRQVQERLKASQRAVKLAHENTQAAKRRADAQERFDDQVQKAQANPEREMQSRTADLVAKGAGFVESQQQAYQETYALINRNMQMFYQLRQDADRFVAMLRQTTRSMMGDDNAVTNLNMGGPGS